MSKQYDFYAQRFYSHDWLGVTQKQKQNNVDVPHSRERALEIRQKKTNSSTEWL